MSNPTKDFNDIKGYLRISASLLGPNDETVILKMGSPNSTGENALMPPNIKTSGYQLKFTVYSGVIISPESETIGVVDP